MKKTFLGIIAMSLLTSMLVLRLNVHHVGSSKPPITEWAQTYGGADKEYAHSMIQTSDGGYALAGFTESCGAGNYDFWLVKTDADGNMQWNRTYGGIYEDAAFSVVQTSDGGYAIVGYFSDPANVNWLLVKTDSDGNMQWNQTYAMTNFDWAHGVAQTDDAGYAIAGYTGHFNGPCDFWLIKTNSTGHPEWNKTYHNRYIDRAECFIKTSDGGFALAGLTGPGGLGRDAWLVKTDSTGKAEWNQTYGGSDNDWINSIVQTNDDGYVLAGFTRSFGAGISDFWLIKTDANGNMEWNKTYGGASNDNAYSVVHTVDGGYTIAGHTRSFGAGALDCWLVRTDLDGNMQWNQTFGGTCYDYGKVVFQTSDGGYTIAGHTDSFGAGNHDFWLIKLAPPKIPTTIDLDPNTLNLKSKGKGITCYIELPEGYDVADIDVSTIMLNDTVPAELHSTQVGDYDEDGIPDLMVKFDREEVISLIESNLNTRERVCTATLTITGKLYDGTPFQGRDSIRVLILRKGDPIPR